MKLDKLYKLELYRGKNNPEPFLWRGIPIRSQRDLLQIMIEITKTGTMQDAIDFKTKFILERVEAERDMGYVTGEMSSATRKQAQHWFEVEHPVFGTSGPTPMEAYDEGRRNVITGRGEPPHALGVTGSYYIDLMAQQMYGPKTNQGWGIPIPMAKKQ